MRSVVVVTALLAALTTLGGRANAQDWKQWVPKLPSSPRSEQKEGARHLMPAPMHLGGDARSPRVIRVRVWAAADFRRQTREWQARFRRLVERVNGVARVWRFEVVEQKSWSRESSEGAMDGLVDELAKLDPGDDVDLVVGLVAALPVFPGAVDNIGMGRMFSRHMVMRSLHDLAEYDAVRRWFDTFTDSEKDAILAARKLHKEQVIFLHEWAHTLGLIHVKREAGIMNPAYDPSMSGFDETELQFIDAALGHRPDELRAIVDKSPDADWDPRDRRQLAAWLAQPAAAPAPTAKPASAAPPGEPPLGVPERTALTEALTLGRAGKHDEAWHRLAAIEAKHPRSAEVKLAACELTERHPAGAARAALTEVACKAAAELAPRDPRPYLWLAELYLDGDLAGRAHLPLTRAGELFAAGNADAEAWRFYTLTLEKAHMPTLAEAAAAHVDAGFATEVSRRAAALRRRDGLSLLPAGATAVAGGEAEFIRAVEAARAALGTPAERAALASLESEFGQFHAADFVRCEGALRRGPPHMTVESARNACHAVLATAPARATLPELRAAWKESFGP